MQLPKGAFSLSYPRSCISALLCHSSCLALSSSWKLVWFGLIFFNRVSFQADMFWSPKTPFPNCGNAGVNKRQGTAAVGQAHLFWQQPGFSFELKRLWKCTQAVFSVWGEWKPSRCKHGELSTAFAQPSSPGVSHMAASHDISWH